MSRISLFIAVLVVATTGTATADDALTITSKPTDAWTQGLSFHQSLSAQGGIGQLTWSIRTGELPDGLELDASGTLSGTPSLPGSWMFEIQVTDEEDNFATKFHTMVINPALVVSTSSLPSWTNGIPVSTGLGSLGGTGAVSWSLAAGDLPGGVSLTSSGQIEGTPEEVGEFSLTFQVEDSLHAKAKRELVWRVNDTPGFGEITVSRWTVLRELEAEIPVTDGTAPYKIELGGGGGGEPDPKDPKEKEEGSLPDGTKFIAGKDRARIAGSPTGAGTFTFEVTVTDVCGATATGEFTIEIGSWPQILTESLPQGMQDAEYSADFSAGDGTPPFLFKVVGGALPGGLELAPDGHLAGVPEGTGTYDVTVEVADASGASASGEFTIGVSPLLKIDGFTLDDWTRGVSIDPVTLSSTGGTGVPVWSYAGPLPAGLQVLQDGVLQGAPFEAGSFVFDVVATDPTGYSASIEISMLVNEQTEMVTDSLVPWIKGRPYEEGIEAQYGTSPVKLSILDGEVPPGLVLSSEGRSGLLAGTPEEAGTFEFTVQAKDRHGVAATRTLTVEIADAPVLESETLEWTEGRAFLFQVNGAGVGGPYEFRVAEGELPPGLHVIGAELLGRVFGTPTAAGEYEFTLEMTDEVGLLNRWSCSMTVNPVVSLTGGVSLVPAEREVSVELSVSGGTPPYEWVAFSGTVPPGLALDEETGVLSGTPSLPGAYSFDVAVRDVSGATEILPIDVYVASPIAVGAKTDESIHGEEDYLYYYFEAYRDARVSLSVKFPTKGETLPDLAVLSDDGVEVSLGGALSRTRNGYRIRKWTTPETGGWYLRFDNRDSRLESSFVMKATAKPARAFSGGVVLAEPELEGEFGFAASAGSTASILVRAPSYADSQFSLRTPQGTLVQLDPSGRTRKNGRTYTLSNVPLYTSGDYTLVIRDGTAGNYSVKIRLKLPRNAASGLK